MNPLLMEEIVRLKEMERAAADRLPRPRPLPWRVRLGGAMIRAGERMAPPHSVTPTGGERARASAT